MSAENQPPHTERLTTWVSQHGPALRTYMLALVRREDVADDLLQEVFRRAWQARDRYREQGTPRAYLIRIADRLVCDRSRRGSREVNLDHPAWERIEPSDAGREPAEAARQTEARGRLAAALNLLSPAQRRVLLLRYYSQMTFSEIAATMNAPLSTTLSHARRGLLALRRLLAETPK